MKKFLLTLFLTLCVGSLFGYAEEASYTIEFNTSTSDSSTAYTTSTFKNSIKTGANLISSVSNTANTYAGKSGLKFSSSSKNGTVTLELAEAAQVEPTRIVISTSAFGTDAGSIKINDKAANNDGTYTVTGTLTQLKIAATKRIYLQSITVYYEVAPALTEVESLTVTPLDLELGDEGTFAVSGPDGFLDDVTLSFKAETENALTVDAEGNYLATGVGSDDITISWADGSVYAAGSYTFTVNVTSDTKIEVSPELSPLTIYIDEEGTFTVTPENFFDGVGSYTISSDNEAVLAVDDTYYLAGEEGTATLTLVWAEGDIYLAGEASFEVTVAKRPVQLDFDGKTFTVALTADAPALNIPEGVEYTITSDNTSVVTLSPLDAKTLWLVGAGTAKITVSTEANDSYSAATASYTLNVTAAAEEKKVTFDFTSSTAYGMELQSGTSQTYEADNRQFVEGDVTMQVQKNGGNGCRLWTGPELRIMNKAIVTFSVPEGCEIKSVDVDGTVNKNTQSTLTTWNITSTSKINTITVTYTAPAATASDLAFAKTERKAIAGQTVVFPGATASAENVRYIATDAEGNATELTVDENGYVSFSADEAGEYTLTAFHDKDGSLPRGVAYGKIAVEPFEQPAAYFLVGHFFDRYYDVTNPCIFTRSEDDENIFTLEGILIGGTEEDGDFGYVITTHCPNIESIGSTTGKVIRREQLTHATDWSTFDTDYVYHAAGTTHASDITSPEHITPYTVEPGIYDFTLDTSNPASPTVATTASDITTGVENIGVEAAADVKYFYLSGRRVEKPAAGGVYIRIQGASATKVAL